MKNVIVKGLLFFISLVVMMHVSLQAQSNGSENSLLKKGNDLIYKGLVSYNKNIIINASDEFNSILKSDSISSIALYGLTFSEYKLLEMSMMKGSGELPDSLYQTAISNAKKLIAEPVYSSEGKTLLAAVYMMKIATSPTSAVTLSPKINGLLDEAESLNPRNPEAYLIRGMMKYNTPEMFGGSYTDAVKNFSKAEELFENSADSIIVNKNWGKLEALAWLGKSYEKLNKPDAAKFAYKKALSLEPDFSWIKFNLLPNLEKENDGNK